MGGTWQIMEKMGLKKKKKKTPEHVPDVNYSDCPKQTQIRTTDPVFILLLLFNYFIKDGFRLLAVCIRTLTLNESSKK